MIAPQQKQIIFRVPYDVWLRLRTFCPQHGTTIQDFCTDSVVRRMDAIERREAANAKKAEQDHE